MRERDARNALKAALMDTGAFSAVWTSGLPENYGQAASNLTAASIDPVGTAFTTGWDAAPWGGLDYTASLTVTVLARDSDPEIRDETAEQLLDCVANAVNGQSLGGLTVPQKTVVTGWRWVAAAPPERRIAATVRFSYLVEGWGSFDTSP